MNISYQRTQLMELLKKAPTPEIARHLQTLIELYKEQEKPVIYNKYQHKINSKKSELLLRRQKLFVMEEHQKATKTNRPKNYQKIISKRAIHIQKVLSQISKLKQEIKELRKYDETQYKIPA